MKNIEKLLKYVFFGNLYFERALWIIYLLNSVGLTFWQVTLLQISLNAAMFLFEFPTGLIADRFRRKNTLVLAHVLIVIYLFALGFLPHFISLVFGFIVFGFGLSLISGTDESLIYESLESEKKENEYQKYFGRYNSINIMSLAFSILLGGFLQNISWSILFIMGILGQLIAISILFSIDEPKYKHKESSTVTEFVKDVFIFIKSSKQYQYIALAIGISHGMMSIIFVYVQSLFADKGMPAEQISIIYFIMLLTTVLSSWFAHKISKLIGNSITVFFGLALTTILYLLTLSDIILIMVIAYVFIEFIFGLWETVLNDMLHKTIVNSSGRASFASFSSFLTSLIMILTSSLFGILSIFTSKQVMYGISGALSSLLAITFVYLGIKVKKELK